MTNQPNLDKLKQIIASLPMNRIVTDAKNNFFGLWNVTDLPRMEQAARLPLFIYGFCVSGTAEFELDQKEYTVSKGDIIRFRPGQILQIKNTSEDICCTLFFFDRKVLGEMIVGIKIPLGNMSPVMQTSPELQASLCQYLDLIYAKIQKINEQDDQYIRRVPEQICKAMLCEILSEVSRQKNTSAAPATRSQDIFFKFARLVQTHFREIRDVQSYAKMLCLSAKYLCRVVGQCSGVTPSQFIDRHVMTEAKYLLSNTTLSVCQISEQLHFPNQSFFGRFFKAHEGCSPGAYRANK